jgi:branched-chain amino acid transport system permease protein
MDLQIGLLLGQDGVINGAIYGLLALALVLVFSVTRVIFIPQGELLTFGALTMAALNTARTPATLWMLIGLAVVCLGLELVRWRRGADVQWRWTLLWTVVCPVAAGALVWSSAATAPLLQAVLAVLIVTPLAPLLYRVVYRPIAGGTVLLLLIVSVALHGVLVGLGLLFFGAEGSRTPDLLDLQWSLGPLRITGQSLVVVMTACALVAALFVFFQHSLMGKALRATAINRTGARLMGIPTELAGDMSFALAGLTGAVAGVLVAPLTTIYYDSGFLIGLKGFVAAILGGLGSYPLAFGGALLVGQLESFSSFWASSFKEVIVFTLIIPVLFWRSLRTHHVEESE